MFIHNVSVGDVRNLFGENVKEYSDRELRAIMKYEGEDMELDYMTFREWDTAESASAACRDHLTKEDFKKLEKQIEEYLEEDGDSLRDEDGNYTDEAEDMFKEELERQHEVIDLLPYSILYK